MWNSLEIKGQARLQSSAALVKKKLVDRRYQNQLDQQRPAASRGCRGRHTPTIQIVTDYEVCLAWGCKLGCNLNQKVEEINIG